MRSIDTLINEGAKALTTGDYAFVLGIVDVPCSIYLGRKLLYVADEHALMLVLLRYRRNLLRLGYLKTIFENVSTTIIGPNNVRLTLNWSEQGGKNKVISNGSMSFYLTHNRDGCWRVTLISSRDAPDPVLLEGLPTY